MSKSRSVFIQITHSSERRQVPRAIMLCALSVVLCAACDKSPIPGKPGADTSRPVAIERAGNQGNPGTNQTPANGPTDSANGAPTRETSTQSGPGTTNPGPGGSGLSGNAISGSTTGAAGGASQTTNSASGATTAGGGVNNTPGQAAGPNGRTGAADNASGTSR